MTATLTTQPQQSKALRRFSKRSVMAALTAILMSAALGLGLAPSASAVSITTWNSPGSLSWIPSETVVGNNCSDSFTTGAFDVYRSPGYAGTQYIRVDYMYYINYSNFQGWQTYSNLYRSAVVAPGYKMTPAATRITPSCGRYYHFSMIVTWYVNGGRAIGQRTFDYNSPSDYTRVGTVWGSNLDGVLGMNPM